MGDCYFIQWCVGILITLLAGIGVQYMLTHMRKVRKRKTLEEKRLRKRANRETSLTSMKNLVEGQDGQRQDRKPDQHRCVSLKIEDLARELRNGSLSPTEVLRSFQSKALAVHSEVNCLTEFISEAETWAGYLENSTIKGPLYGIPISLKDVYAVQGYDCTLGCANFVDQPYADDCTLVKVLKKQGGIPFVKTNVPQLLCSMETSNMIYGRTVNPFNHACSPGGSSGGESALIASSGSPLGWGSDSGGSIRYPAHCTGICGLKPTARRLSHQGMPGVDSGQDIVPHVLGPMAPTVEGLVLLMKAVLVPCMFEVDPTIPPIPFRNEIYESQQRLRIGYYMDDGVVPAVPACQRAVSMATTALQIAGHDVIKMDTTGFDNAQPLTSAVWNADGGSFWLDMIEGEDFDECTAHVFNAWSMPNWMKKLAAIILWPFNTDLAEMYKTMAGVRNIREYWKLRVDVQEFRRKVIEKWKAQGLDAVVCPVSANTAMECGHPKLAGEMTSYIKLYNILDFPAGVVPVTRVTKDDVVKLNNYQEQNATQTELKMAMKMTENLPVGVQCVTLPFQEELCLRVMKELEHLVHTRTKEQDPSLDTRVY